MTSKLASFRITPGGAIIFLLSVGAGAAFYILVMASQPAFKGDGGVNGFEYAREARIAPDAPFLNAAGEETSLADFEGQTVLVNLWATWCAPCVEELPSLNRLQTELGGPDFKVAAISLDTGDRAEVAAFMERYGVDDLDLYSDPTLSIAFALDAARSVPATILFDAEGREIGRTLRPAEWDSDEAKALIGRAIERQAEERENDE